MDDDACKIYLERDSEKDKYTLRDTETRVSEGEIGLDFENPNNLILRAPWGKDKSILYWVGKMGDGGTTIVWNGKSKWYKCSE